MKLTPPSDDVMWSKCRVGHNRHDWIYGTMVPPWPMSNMRIYSWRQYGGQHLDWWQDYCPAQDVVSQAIDLNGTWERHESLLYLDILKHGLPDPGKVIDFGCHLGWYSTIADRLGYDVTAIDVNAENALLARLNAPTATVHLGVVDEHAEILPAEKIRCVKIDLEGAEQWAVRMIEPSLEYRLCDFILMEVSPVFNTGYPALVDRIQSYGYDVYLVPSNDRDAPARFQDHPLKSVLTGPTFDPGLIPDLHQVDVMFTRTP